MTSRKILVLTAIVTTLCALGCGGGGGGIEASVADGSEGGAPDVASTDAGLDARATDGASTADAATDGVADAAQNPDAVSPPDAASSEWLSVQGNRILLGTGARFHGRGANLHDERSCEACSFAPRDPRGLERWADELIVNWHANFIRFLLSAKAAPYNSYEQQWQSLVDDSAYYADVQANVAHMTAHPGVYVMVTLFSDPTIKDNNGEFDSEWPSSLGDSNTRYRLLAEAFYANPHVLFGLTNEPHGPASHDAELATRYLAAIAAIRAVEDSHHAQHHVVVVQAPEGYARDLSYFVAHPLAGDNIAYEIHPYNHSSDFDSLVVRPAATLPVLIGEYGPVDTMTNADITALWALAQAHEIPYLAWNFHQNCPPNLLQNTASDGCGFSATIGYDFPRTAWGDMLFAHLATPW